MYNGIISSFCHRCIKPLKWIYVREQHFNRICDTHECTRIHTNMQTAFTHVNVYMECKYYVKRATRYNIYFSIHYLHEIGSVSIQSVHNQLLLIY